MHSAFNMRVFLILCSNHFFFKGNVLSGEIALKVTIIIITDLRWLDLPHSHINVHKREDLSEEKT